MKKSLLYVVLILSLISCTNYYTVLLQEDTALYSSCNSETSTTVIPKGTEVYLSSKPTGKITERSSGEIITVGQIILSIQHTATILGYHHILLQ